MATYKKLNITARFQTLMDFSIDGDSASLEQFKAHKTASIKGQDESETLIPFHAMRVATTQISSTDEEKADPYCK